jgi:hypothetical protein
MGRFKWHILSLVRAIICGKENYPLNSRQIERAAKCIIEKMAQHGTLATDVFMKAVDVCRSMGPVGYDGLKRQAILTEMLAKI